MLKVGPIQLNTNLMLAPIAGHCDLPFRITARQCGSVGLAFTDLLCPHGILKQNIQTKWLMKTDARDQPLGMQLYGNDAKLMCEAARWAIDAGATTLDINMGCPVDKVTKTFAGSKMLCAPDHAVEVAKQLIKTAGDAVPVTAKLRLGFYHNELTAPALAKQLIEAGIACITIHGRTAEQKFKGKVNLDGIAAVVDAVHETGNRQIPCIGNGDIKTPFDAQNMIEQTRCDGVMIGRAALGAPWIFKNTHELLTTGTITEWPLAQRIEALRTHGQLLMDMRDTQFGINRMRQKIGVYSKHLGPCKPLRLAMQKITTPQQFHDLLDQFLETNANQIPMTWQQRHCLLHKEYDRLAAKT